MWAIPVLSQALVAVMAEDPEPWWVVVLPDPFVHFRGHGLWKGSTMLGTVSVYVIEA